MEVLTSKIGRFLKFVKIPLILRKIFENMAAESGSVHMYGIDHIFHNFRRLLILKVFYSCSFKKKILTW
jgi:hypothetical protein